MPTPTTKKKPKRAKVRKSKNKNLVLYVESNTLKGKVFSNGKELKAFVEEFGKKYPSTDKKAHDDNWIDLVVTNMKSSIVSLDSTLKIQ